MNFPEGAYPSPVTSINAPFTDIFRTVILFSVSVPVLSVQITVAQPSASTACNFRTITFFLTMRCTPIASVIVTTAGSPSGTAATARLTDARNISFAAMPCKVPVMKTTMQIMSAPMPMYFASCFIRL